MKITFEGADPSRFRSHLELEVATELDRHGVTWRYEVRVELPDGRRINYLPDFAIDDAKPDLELPPWLECKPQQMIYDLRDTLGVTRRAGEYFDTDVIVEGCDADRLKASGVDELWKPKKLAELTGDQVLVVGAVGGVNRLSVEMAPEKIIFSRRHPFPNWRGHEQRLEREATRARRAREYEEWQQRYAAQQAAQAERTAALAVDREARQAQVASIRAQYMRHVPKFPSSCWVCSVRGETGGIYRVPRLDGTERWIRICPGCEVGPW